jgi:hypothetical protein
MCSRFVGTTGPTTSNGMLDNLSSLFTDAEPVQLKPGHRYRSEITGQAFIVQSVQPTTPIEFLDAADRPKKQDSVRESILRDAIRDGVIVHDEQRCGQCR